MSTLGAGPCADDAPALGQDALKGSLWQIDVAYRRDHVTYNENEVSNYGELPRRGYWMQRFTGTFEIGAPAERASFSPLIHRGGSYEGTVRAYTVNGYDNPEKDRWVQCPDCTGNLKLSETTPIGGTYYFEPPDVTQPPFNAGINFWIPSFDEYGMLSVAIVLVPTDDVLALASQGCAVECQDTQFSPGSAPVTFGHSEGRNLREMSFLMNMRAIDQIQRTQYGGGQLYVRLQCLRNCNEVNCGGCDQPGLCSFELCDDGNKCTDDLCIQGVGCVHNPATAEGFSCDRDVCHTGTCQAGVCVGSNPIDCDDHEECTDPDQCIQPWGCVNNPADRPIKNPDPQDCKQVVCLQGSRVDDYPDDLETPPASSDPCIKRRCQSGEILEWTDPDNPACMP